MKKVFLAAILGLSFGIANAQQVRFGVKAGLNLATFSGDAVGSDVKMKAGLHAGGLVEIKFTDKLALQPELLFSMQGAEIVDKGDNGTGGTFKDEYKRNLTYLNVPILLKFYPVNSFFLEGGPQVGFLVDAKSKNVFTDTNGTATTIVSTESDVKDNYKSTDFSFNVGLGYDFTQNLFASARYNIGLSNINDLKGAFGIYEIDRKNSVLSFSLGYKF